MDDKICGQCVNKNERAGCKICFKRGRSIKECLNFYPRLGTIMFLKFLRTGRLKPEDVAQAKLLAEQPVLGVRYYEHI